KPRDSKLSMPRPVSESSHNHFWSEDAEQPLQGIEIAIHDALLEGNDRVLSNRDGLGAYLPATSRDVAVADVVLSSQIADAVFSVQRMHFKRSGIDEQARTNEFVVLVVLAQYVANILAEETLDTLAKFLHTLDVGLLHAPRAVWCVGGPGLELFDRLLGSEVPRNVRDQIANDRERVH